MIRRELNFGDLMSVCIGLRKEEWDTVVAFGGARDIDALIVRGYNYPGPKWAFTDENDYTRTLLVGGFIPHRAGVYSSWFLATAYAWEHHARELTETAIERQQFMFDSGAHRIETLCLASHKLAHRWYKTVGLRLESTKEGFCVDGSDASLFVSTRRKH